MNYTEKDLLRFNLKNYYLIVADTETESLNLLENKPTEIAWLKNEEQHQYFPFFPDIKLSKDAAIITRFDYHEYKRKGIDPKVVCDKFDEVLYDPKSIIVGQNWLGFDYAIINHFRLLCGKKTDYSYLKRTIDTKCLMMAIHLNSSPPAPLFSNDFLAWQYCMLRRNSNRKFKTSIDAMCDYFNVENDKNRRHEGLYDIIKTKEIFNQLIWKVNVYV